MAGRHQKYDWDTLLDGDINVIPDSELDVVVNSFRVAARAAAERRGKRVTVTKIAGGVAVRAEPVEDVRGAVAAAP